MRGVKRITEERAIDAPYWECHAVGSGDGDGDGDGDKCGGAAGEKVGGMIEAREREDGPRPEHAAHTPHTELAGNVRDAAGVGPVVIPSSGATDSSEDRMPARAARHARLTPRVLLRKRSGVGW